MHEANESPLITERTLAAGPVSLHVVECGQGIPLVLVHGFPLDHAMWTGQIAALARDYHVIAPDLRGFGASQATAGTVTMAEMAEDLDAMLIAMGINTPVVLCGLSMGGYVAFQFWRKYASKVRALVLCDTRALPDTPEGAAGRLKTAAEVLATGTEGVADAMIPKLFAPATIESHPDVVSHQRRIILAGNREGIAAALRGMAERPDSRPLLPTISVPTLVVVGQHDAIASVDEMRALAEAIPSAQFVVIPDAGHMAPLENPAAFNAALQQFLKQV